jgi:histidine triad (HIT) family protein
MIVRAMAPQDEAERQAIGRRAEELRQGGICPTCHNLKHGGVYPPVDERLIYQDDVVVCFLERYPRNPGHTIVLVRPHFEDILRLPEAVAQQVYPVMHAVAKALEAVLGAEKVYVCSMCDGKRNHLHYQLIPRLPGDEARGSRLFVKARGVLDESADVVQALRSALARPETG